MYEYFAASQRMILTGSSLSDEGMSVWKSINYAFIMKKLSAVILL